MKAFSIVAAAIGVATSMVLAVVVARGTKSAAAGDGVKAANLQIVGPSAAKAHPQQSKAVLDAAHAAYETTKADYDEGMAVFSEVYDWSRRWLDAELSLAADRPAQVAALQKHWTRMKRSYDAIEKLNAAGARGGEKQKLTSARFFVAEAELWLAVAEGALPKEVPD